MVIELDKRARYDVEAIRRDFPILETVVHGKPLVYLDNGASAQKPQQVLDVIQDTYAHSYANVHRGLHFLSNKATDAFELSREKVRRFLNAGHADEIVFTRSATESINLVSYGLADDIGEGDEIVLTVMEHHSNIVPWHFLRERKGAKLVFVPVAEDGSIAVEDFAKAIGPRTRLVAMTHMSNVLGTVTPVRAVVELAMRRAYRCWWTAARPPCICLSTCRRSVATTTCSPGTRCTGPPGSASCTAGPRPWTGCAPSTVAAR